MRIGLVLPAIPAYSETFFRSKVSGLIANGHEVVVFVNGKTSETQYCGARVVCSFSTQRNRMLLLLRAKVTLFVLLVSHTKIVFRFIKSERKEHTPWLKLISGLLLNAALLSERLDWLHFGFGTMALGREHVADAIGAKMAVSFRGFDYYVYPIKNSGCYTKLWSKTVRYHVLSESMKSGLISYGIPDSAIFVIPPAIDTAFFSAHSAIQSNKSLQILTIGRLHWIKGLDYTLEALALLHQKGVAFHYTIIGTGPEEERLRFTAHQLGIAAFVTFAGKQSPEYIKKQLEQTDLYVQYSIQEGFGNAVLEAQAMGVYCVVSDAEGLQENVVHGVTGSVVPKRNPEALVAGIQAFLGEAAMEKIKINEQAIARVKRDYSVEKQKLKFKAFYESS
ncbi:MAG: glycosyltransferase family 4 protein [Flavobacterium sp.]|nr:glycosyltransferase family 4 protein [Flavobacterium sp.]